MCRVRDSGQDYADSAMFTELSESLEGVVGDCRAGWSPNETNESSPLAGMLLWVLLEPAPAVCKPNQTKSQ